MKKDKKGLNNANQISVKIGISLNLKQYLKEFQLNLNTG